MGQRLGAGIIKKLKSLDISLIIYHRIFVSDFKRGIRNSMKNVSKWKQYVSPFG